MSMFIDMKGKHKENKGVEFPVKKETEGMPMPSPGGQGNEQEGKPDIKRIRMMLALNLLNMRLFGFTEEEPQEQGLETEGSVQIAFNWDSTNIMHIEYLIPLKMLETDISSLNQKQISIGWKINGIEMQGASSSTGPSIVRTGVVAVPAGSGVPTSNRTPGGFGGSRPGGGKFSQVDMDNMMKEQDIWAKYTFTIPN